MIRIHKADLTHLPWLRKFLTDMLAEDPITYPTIDEPEFDNMTLILAKALGEPAVTMLVASDADAHPLGFLAYELFGRSVGRPHVAAQIHWLYVDAAARHQGVSRALTDAGITDVTAKGITHVEFFAPASHGDRWIQRVPIATPFLTRYVVDLRDLVQPAANGHDTSQPIELVPQPNEEVSE